MYTSSTIFGVSLFTDTQYNITGNRRSYLTFFYPQIQLDLILFMRRLISVTTQFIYWCTFDINTPHNFSKPQQYIIYGNRILKQICLEFEDVFDGWVCCRFCVYFEREKGKHTTSCLVNRPWGT